jgi:large subunit ribosomal protein L28
VPVQKDFAPGTNPLTVPLYDVLPPPFPPKRKPLIYYQDMAQVCQITGVRKYRGRRIHHSGKSKKSGGIGLNHVKKVNRTFSPNLRDKRIWVPELKKFVRVRLSARALKTVTKNGAFSVLKEAGLI